jgi:2-aminoadipate transaminase
MANRTTGKAIQEITDLIAKPDIISFAGGLPPEEAFPVDDLNGMICSIIQTNAKQALQYGDTYGLRELRQEIAKNLSREQCPIEASQILIVTAAQQALDLLAKCFINPGDRVVCSLPSYLGGIDTFHSYGAEMVGIPMDDEGMRVDILEDRLDTLIAVGQRPKFIYIVPDFQNPSGITTTLSRRKKIIEVAAHYRVPIVEDSPYSELRYRGENIPRIMELGSTEQVITLGTFSKTFVPGIRLGWIAANQEIIDKLALLKQTTDICTGSLAQCIILEFMKQGKMEVHLKRICGLYHHKRDMMLAALKKYMPNYVRWTEPEGGLFLFVTLPAEMNARELLKIAVHRKVAFVPGEVFFCDGSGTNTMRLNYSYANEQLTDEGIKRLADSIRLYYDNLINLPSVEKLAGLEDLKSFEEIY